MEALPNTALVAINLRLERPRTYEKTNTTILLKKHINNMNQNDILIYSTIMRDASSCSTC